MVPAQYLEGRAPPWAFRRLSIQEELVKCLQLMKMRTWRNTPFNCFSYIFSTVFYQVMTKTDRLKEH